MHMNTVACGGLRSWWAGCGGGAASQAATPALRRYCTWHGMGARAQCMPAKQRSRASSPLRVWGATVKGHCGLRRSSNRKAALAIVLLTPSGHYIRALRFDCMGGRHCTSQRLTSSC